MINEKDFLQALTSFEEAVGQGTRKYPEETKKALSIDIRKEIKPTGEEWFEALKRLRLSEDCRFMLPGIAVIRSTTLAVRKEFRKQQQPIKVDCDRCDGLGFLFRNMIDESGKPVRLAMGCGCGATPKHVEPDMMLRSLRDKGLVTDKDVFNYRGQRTLAAVNPGEEKKKKWQGVIDLYRAGRWVPKWMKERFDAGNFDRPAPGEWIQGRVAMEQMKDVPRPGENKEEEQIEEAPF